MHDGKNYLLCELHAHTTFSDGDLTLRQTVDLYGRNGFDVLCITDHCVRADDPWLEQEPLPNHINASNFGRYLDAVELEATRAKALYDLLVLPGLELTDQHDDPRNAAHAVALGLRRFVEVEHGIDWALAEARAAGAVLIAAHPYEVDEARRSNRGTARFSIDRSLHPLVDRFELVNRHDFFPWVAAAQLPYVANGDFHRLEHLETWKTVIPCAKSESAITAYLRSQAPVHITRFQSEQATEELVA